MKLNKVLVYSFVAVFCFSSVELVNASTESWKTKAFQVSDKDGLESRYIYVGRGVDWGSPIFTSTVTVSNPTSLSVRLNDRAVYAAKLEGTQTIEFPLNGLKSGFNRLDFSVRQSPLMSVVQGNDCDQETFGLFNLSEGEINFDRKVYNLKISNLPDVLFNPEVLDRKPYAARFRVDTRSQTELTALSRLASAWPAVSGVRWIEASNDESIHADFTVELNYDESLKNKAEVSLYFAEGRIDNEKHPILRINYGTEKALLSAVNGLTNKNYSQQLNSNNAILPDYLGEPKWAKLKSFETLADLGISSFRLDSGDQSLFLNFPSAWQITGPLEGSLAFKSQSSLIQGSNLTIWINNILSGGAGLEQLPEKNSNRKIPFLGEAKLNNNNFELRVESNLLLSGDCTVPKGTIWVDTKKSDISLPYRVKRGVASVNAFLVNDPVISVDGNEGGFAIAIALLQESSRMLLSRDPLRSEISIGKKEKTHVIVDEKAYKARVAEYPESIYPEYANGGVFITASNNSFEVLAQNKSSVESFINYWSRIQPQFEDDLMAILVTQDGEVRPLQYAETTNPLAPRISGSSIYTYTLFIVSLMLSGLIGWLWWKRRAPSKN